MYSMNKWLIQCIIILRFQLCSEQKKKTFHVLGLFQVLRKESRIKSLVLLFIIVIKTNDIGEASAAKAKNYMIQDQFEVILWRHCVLCSSEIKAGSTNSFPLYVLYIWFSLGIKCCCTTSLSILSYSYLCSKLESKLRYLCLYLIVLKVTKQMQGSKFFDGPPSKLFPIILLGLESNCSGFRSVFVYFDNSFPSMCIVSYNKDLDPNSSFKNYKTK